MSASHTKTNSKNQKKPDLKKLKRLHESTSSESDTSFSAEGMEQMISSLMDQKFGRFRQELNDDLKKMVEEHIAPLQGTVDEMQQQHDELKSSHDELLDRVTELEADNKILRNSVHDSQRMSNDTEQYSRKYSYRVTGMKQEASESPASAVVKLLKEKLHLPSIVPPDIAIAHPLPRPRHAAEDEPPPIYFRVANPHLRESILKNRKQLKGTGIAIRDDLTRLNAQLLNRVNPNKCDMVESSWFHNGKILFKPRGHNITVHIRPYEDIAKVIASAMAAAAARAARAAPRQAPNATPPTGRAS